DVCVIPNAVDVDMFNPVAREKRRVEARQCMGFGTTDFVLLLVGNDWKKKGLTCLLDAGTACKDLALKVLVCGRDDPAPYEVIIRRLGLQERVRFAEPSTDVVQFYAAADAYVGPSLEDAFALPPAEAMACGLPVVVSAQAGVSEIIHEGVDGLILRDPRDVSELTRKLHLLYTDVALRRTLSEKAARTAQRLSWERNAEETRTFLDCARNRKIKMAQQAR